VWENEKARQVSPAALNITCLRQYTNASSPIRQRSFTTSANPLNCGNKPAALGWSMIHVIGSHPAIGQHRIFAFWYIVRAEMPNKATPGASIYLMRPGRVSSSPHNPVMIDLASKVRSVFDPSLFLA